MKIERRRDHTAQEHIFRVYPFADSEALLINNGQASYIEAIRNLRTGDVRFQVNIQMTGDWSSPDLDKIMDAIDLCQKWAEHGDYSPRPTHWDKTIAWEYIPYEVITVGNKVIVNSITDGCCDSIEEARAEIQKSVEHSYEMGYPLSPTRLHWWIAAGLDSEENYESIVVEVAFWDAELRRVVFMPIVPEKPTPVFQPEFAVGDRVRTTLFARPVVATVIAVHSESENPYELRFDEYDGGGTSAVYRASDLELVQKGRGS